LLPESAGVQYIVVRLASLNDRDRAILDQLKINEFIQIDQTGDIALLKRTAPAPTLEPS
jgi:hypothetical protein